MSSPRFPRSNGLAEKGVQIVKRLLKKCAHSGQDFWLGLLTYRATPLECGSAPAELLMRRKTRTLLPDFVSEPARPVFKHKQDRKRGRALSQLEEGDAVRVRDDKDKGWSAKAQVTCDNGPRSYKIQTEKGTHIRRNRQHLLKTSEEFNPYDELESEAYDTADEDAESPEARVPTFAVSSPDTSSPGRSQQDNSTSTTSQLDNRNQACLQGSLPLITPRQSTREVRVPRRLTYDENFNQVCK